MDGHEWAHVDVDGYGMGMGTNSKENVGLYTLGRRIIQPRVRNKHAAIFQTQ